MRVFRTSSTTGPLTGSTLWPDCRFDSLPQGMRCAHSWFSKMVVFQRAGSMNGYVKESACQAGALNGSVRQRLSINEWMGGCRRMGFSGGNFQGQAAARAVAALPQGIRPCGDAPPARRSRCQGAHQPNDTNSRVSMCSRFVRALPPSPSPNHLPSTCALVFVFYTGVFWT